LHLALAAEGRTELILFAFLEEATSGRALNAGMRTTVPTASIDHPASHKKAVPIMQKILTSSFDGDISV